MRLSGLHSGVRNRLLFGGLVLLLIGLACGTAVPEQPGPPTTGPGGNPIPIPLPVSPTPGGPPPGLTAAQVINVVDGDTIDVRLNGREYRVRYILIDTPETKHPTIGEEPFGPEAFAANRELVKDKTVYLEKDVSETDQYGRLLRYVYVDDLLINEELLRRGLATVAVFPPDVKYVDRFREVQQEARQAQRGLWRDFPAPGSESLTITVLDKVAEYAEIKNVSEDVVPLTGWTLVSERGNQPCPLGGSIWPGDTLRIWAQASDAAQGGFNCGFERSIWSNDAPDPAVLINPDGFEVSRLE